MVMQAVEQVGTPNDLIEVFRTIPSDGYYGYEPATCLVGWPVVKGVLQAEYEAYEDAHAGTDDEYKVDEVTWLAQRYGVDEDRLFDVYNAVADYSAVRTDLGSAIRFAEEYLVKESTDSVVQALKNLGLIDQNESDEEYEEEEW
jgi:hypothetical protein